MAYGIAFDMDTNCYKDYIKGLEDGLTDNQAKSRLSKVYKEIEEAMYKAGFVRLQGSLYRSESEDLNYVFSAIDNLSKIQGFKDCVDSVHAFKLEGWSDLTARIR